MQVTPCMRFVTLPFGFGLGIFDQSWPFHDSTKVWISVPLNEDPTAVHKAALAQATLAKAVWSFPGGPGCFVQ